MPGVLSPERKVELRKKGLKGGPPEKLCRTSVLRHNYLKEAQTKVNQEGNGRIQLSSQTITLHSDGTIN